jgi:ATP-dependent DNA helicase RecG
MIHYEQSESSVLELKGSIPVNKQILKTVVGFCNQFGGRIIIGIDDSQEVIGIEEERAEELLEFMHKTIYESCSPPIVPEIYTQRICERLVLVIQVSMGSQKPYYIRSLGVQDGTFIRLGRSTLKADTGTIADLQRQNRGITFDKTPLFSAATGDLNESLVTDFLKNRPAGYNSGSYQQILESYHCITKEQTEVYPTIAGILSFSTDPQQWFPEAIIICSRFSGISGRETLATRDFSGTLFEQYRNVYDFVLSQLNRKFTINGPRRNEEYEIPPVAIREALVNMIVHRNYSIPGPSKIAIYDDRIEFFSPGVFPGPIDTNNLGAGITYIRNSVIARLFREAGYIEKLGTGFITIIESCLHAGLPMPVVTEGTNFVKCIISRIREQPADRQEHHILIQRLFSTCQEIGVTDVIKTLGISRPTAVRRLSEMVKLGLIRRTGAGASTRYRRNLG